VEGVRGGRREGERVTGAQAESLAGHVDQQLSGQHEHELNVGRQRVRLTAAAPARLDLAQDGLHPLLARRCQQVFAHPLPAEVDRWILAFPDQLALGFGEQ